MAIITQKFAKQCIGNNTSGKGNPIVDTSYIAVADTYGEEGTGLSLTSTWTPLSSYLGEMRTKIAKQQLFD